MVSILESLPQAGQKGSAVLARTDEVSSTEMLLNVIRGQKGPDPLPAPPSPAQGLKRSILDVLPIKKPVTVSIDIGENEIRLVKVTAQSGEKYQIVDWRKVTIDPGLGRDSNLFVSFLQQAVADFTRNEPHAAFWTTISSVDVETRYLRIPKVAKSQIANAVFWTYKREAQINESKDIFDYKVIGERMEEGTEKLDVIAYTAPRQRVEATRKLFASAGLQLTGISIVPFAIQNLFRTGWISADKNVCTLFIGRDWSRIAIYSGDNLILSRDIKAGLEGMVESIAETLETQRPGATPTDLDERTDDLDRTSATMEKAQSLLQRLTRGAWEQVAEEMTEQDDETFHTILPALERVARQVERTIDHYRIQFSNETVAKVFISGDLGAHPRVMALFQDQVGIPFEVIDPFAQTAQGERADVAAPPLADRNAFLPAVGMALSDNELTPNFLFTSKDRQRHNQVQRFNRSIFTFSALFMAICIGAYVWQMHWIAQKKIQAKEFQNHLDRYVPRVDQNLIMQLAANNLGHFRSVEASGQKVKSVAIIGEVCAKIPQSIRLDHLTLDLGRTGGPQAGKKAVMVLEGMVTGDRFQFESTLAGFLMRLKDSPLFKQAQIIRQALESRGRQEALRFTAQIELR